MNRRSLGAAERADRQWRALYTGVRFFIGIDVFIMEALFKELYDQLNVELRAVSPEQNAVRGYNILTELVEGSIGKLRSYLYEHPFPDKKSEISYFRHWAPQFFKLQILYTSLYNLERTRITAQDKAFFDRHIKKRLRSIRQFLKRHKDLRLYYHLQETNRDHELFVSTKPTKTEDFLTAEGYYCKNSIALAKIMAYEELLPILSREITEGLPDPAKPDPGSRAIKKKYVLNLSKAQAAELIYSLVKMKAVSVDGQFADIKDIVEFVKDTFGYDIPNIYDVELHNKRRKKERAPFLTDMLNSYLKADE